MDVEIKVFTGHEMTSQDFAILIETMFPGRSGIIYGCNISVSDARSGLLHISAGWAIVRGRLVYINAGDLQISLPTSTQTKYIVLKISLSSTDKPAVVEAVDTVETDTKDFNQSAGTARLVLASITAQNTGLVASSLETLKAIPSSPTIRTGTAAPDNNVGVDGDIYIQYK